MANQENTPNNEETPGKNKKPRSRKPKRHTPLGQDWKAWADHPYIVFLTLTIALITLVVGIAQIALIIYPTTPQKREQEEGGEVYGIGLTEYFPSEPKVKLGIYYDRRNAINPSILDSYKGHMKRILNGIYPEEINVVSFGPENKQIWESPQKTLGLFSKFQENNEVVKLCPQQILNEPPSKTCLDTVRQSLRRNDRPAQENIDTTLDIFNEGATARTGCLDFNSIFSRVDADKNHLSLILTDAKKVCATTSASTDSKIVVLLAPAVGDVDGLLEERKLFLEKLFPCKCNLLVIPFFSASSETILKVFMPSKK